MIIGEAEFGAIARAMAESLRTAVDAGWSVATVQVRQSGPASAITAWSDVQPRVHVDCRSLGLDLGEFAWAAEVRLLATGEYVVTTSPVVDKAWPGRLVLDHDYRFDRHPLPGMPRPATAEPTGAPTDPAVLAEVTRLTAEFAEIYTAVKGHAPKWEPPRTEEEIAAAEARIGARLPDDLRALHLVVGGDPEETGLLGLHSHYSLERVVERYLDEEPGSYGWSEGLDEDGVVFETVPFGTVKRLSRNDWWVTFGSDDSTGFVAVDLDPADRGRVGQVIGYGRGIDEAPQHVSWSVADMIADVVAALRAGKYEEDEEDDDDEDPRLIAEVGFRDGSERDHSEIVQRTAAADLPARVAAILEADQVQELYLNDPEDVDLGVFETLPSLRMIRVNRGQAVTTAIGGCAALESLHVGAHRVDLTGLADHPEFWDLRLDVTEPVDLAPLRAVPRLTRLHLAGSEVADLEPIRELRSLRVLTLNAAQARRLVEAGGPVPGLAGFYLTGNVSLRDAFELPHALSGGGIAPTLTEFSGTLR